MIAFAGFGASQMADSQQNSSDTAAAGSAPEAAAPMLGTDDSGLQRYATGSASLPPDDRILVTGTNYTGAQLQESSSASKTGQSEQRAFASTAPAVIASDPELAALQRLWDRDALLVCLQAIADENGGPIEVQSVDYARFQGAPAVVVRYVLDGEQKGWAVGANCGTQGAGADRL